MMALSPMNHLLIIKQGITGFEDLLKFYCWNSAMRSRVPLEIAIFSYNRSHIE